MPAIVGSAYGPGLPQIDGRFYVTEVLILDTGEVRSSTYLAEAEATDADMQAHLDATTGGAQDVLDTPVTGGAHGGGR